MKWYLNLVLYMNHSTSGARRALQDPMIDIETWYIVIPFLLVPHCSLVSNNLIHSNSVSGPIGGACPFLVTTFLLVEDVLEVACRHRRKDHFGVQSTVAVRVLVFKSR